jgi:hypothetical protein
VALVQEQGQHWGERHGGSKPDMGELLNASSHLAGRQVDLFAMDRSLANEPIGGRRSTDQQVSSQYGSRH